MNKTIAHNLLNDVGYSSVFDFQKDHNLVVDGIIGMGETYPTLYNALLKNQNVAFSGYHMQYFEKKQIVLHHSAGWDDARGMFHYWQNDARYHVATSVGITDDGTLYRGFDEGQWAVHIGAWGLYPNYRQLESHSIGVEICNWGALKNVDGDLQSWTGAKLKKSKAIKLDYKGVEYYEKYTASEIETLRLWILLNAMRFDIPLDYDDDIFDICPRAIRGEKGIFTHNSYISWKSDVSPQPALIQMLKELKHYNYED